MIAGGVTLMVGPHLTNRTREAGAFRWRIGDIVARRAPLASEQWSGSLLRIRPLPIHHDENSAELVTFFPGAQ
jgi:hypothetical protein